MLDPWIIEEIRRREEEERQHREQPVLEIPMDLPVYPNQSNPSPTPGEERGVVIVDFRV
jgi:hypothetical protein